MITSTIFVRTVNADKGRGFVLLVGYDAKIVQSNAIQQISLTTGTEAEYAAAIARVKANYNASEIRDVTNDGIKRKMEKQRLGA
jgi:hypothetical protein